MAKISIFLPLLYLYLTTFGACVQSEGNSLEDDYDGLDDGPDDGYNGLLPPAVIEYLKSNPDDANIESTGVEMDPVVKIFGGVDAQPVDFPHQVYLTQLNRNGRREQFCGASIIHPYLLLCAAHCFDINPQNVTATAGGYAGGFSVGTEQVRDVTHVFGHPKYDNVTWKNDISVLVLNQSLDFDQPNVKAVHLREPTWVLPARANVSGYGITRRGFTSTTLQAAEVPFVDHDSCTERMKKFGAVTENNVCAGANGSDACPGDSGGPLTCAKDGANGRQEYYLCGVVSWGIPCKYRGKYPTIYTDVSKYLGWIRKFTRVWWRHSWLTVFGQSEGENGECGEGQFQCPNNGLCILDEFKCDGENDCYPCEDWDERNCTTIVCAHGQFACNSTQTCIPDNYVCDGDDDCKDGSDELDCEED